MAHPNPRLINALREAAARLHAGAPYSWGHHGSCNCGQLLQVITHLSKEEILRQAHSATGEWTEIAETYCAVTSLPAYVLISKLEAAGLTTTDIHGLEYLQDREVLNALPNGFRWLKRNERADVILYFETLAHLLEKKLSQQMKIQQKKLNPSVSESPAPVSAS
jgi:hypothetical protein